MRYTYEEYKEQIKREFIELWPNLLEEEVEKFFISEEVKAIIQERYKFYIDKDSVLHGTGSTGSVSYCLSLLY